MSEHGGTYRTTQAREEDEGDEGGHGYPECPQAVFECVCVRFSKCTFWSLTMCRESVINWHVSVSVYVLYGDG